jgi:transcriptional antiterminator Rof (Rho-off)
LVVLGAAARAIQLHRVGHLIERCDFIDMLEESVRLHRPLVVELKDGRSFTDEARDVITEASGQEWAVFRFHDRLSLDEISSCRPAAPVEPTYRGKTAGAR